MVTIEVREREARPIVNLTQPGPKGILGNTTPDFHAAVKGRPGIWGADRNSAEAAVGSALVTAATMVKGFSLPADFRNRTYSEIGAAALNGSIPNVTVETEKR